MSKFYAITALAILAATPGYAGCYRDAVVEVDCPVKHPSNNPENVYGRILRTSNGSIDITRQWAEHNALTDAITAEALQRTAAEAADRTAKAYEKEASAAAKAENARGNLVNSIAGNVNSKR